MIPGLQNSEAAASAFFLFASCLTWRLGTATAWQVERHSQCCGSAADSEPSTLPADKLPLDMILAQLELEPGVLHGHDSAAVEIHRAKLTLTSLTDAWMIIR